MHATPYFEGSRRNVVPFIPASAHRILEIGCGAGGFRQHFAPGIEYWGVELDQEAAKIARSRLTTVLNMPFDAAVDHLPDSHFDLVVCNDVIEHLPDHDRFLQLIKRKLGPDGCLIGSIPNVRYVLNLYELLLRRDWRYRDEGILDRTHLRFFTEKSLRRTLIDNGYEIERLQGIDAATVRSLDAKRVAIWLARTILGSDTQYRQFGFRVRPQH